MSGFLERLVASSRRPPSIKPILGSVFTAPRDVGILEEVASEAFGETFKEAGQIEHRKDLVTDSGVGYGGGAGRCCASTRESAVTIKS